MASNRDQFNKIIAVAVSPGAYDAEAIAALRKARDLVKNDPSLAHPPPAPPAPPPKTPTAPEQSYGVKITNIAPFWLHILLNSLSQQAFGLGLKSQLSIDVSTDPSTAVEVRCDGSTGVCTAFEAHVNWLLDYINSQPRDPRVTRSRQ
jgi:hypothetical protein